MTDPATWDATAAAITAGRARQRLLDALTAIDAERARAKMIYVHGKSRSVRGYLDGEDERRARTEAAMRDAYAAGVDVQGVLAERMRRHG